MIPLALFVDVIPHNSTKMKIIPLYLLLNHIIIKPIPHNSPLMNIIPHTPIFIPRCSIFNSTPCNLELCGINVYSTQPIAYSTQKKFYTMNLFLILHVVLRLERGIRHFLFYLTLVFCIRHWPVLFHIISRKVWSKFQMRMHADLDDSAARTTRSKSHLSVL